MGIRFLSVDWVLAQAMSPTDRHAYETLKARMLEAYRTRPPAPAVTETETPEDIEGTLDNARDQDALLDWMYAGPGRANLILEDRSLGGMEFRTSGKDAHLSPAVYQSLTAQLESVGVDPKSRE